MIECKPIVKDTLAPVVIFCLVLVIVTVLATFFFIVSLIGAKLSLLPAVTWEMILRLVPAALTQMLLPATLLSLLLSLVRARRRPGLVLVTYLALGALAFAVLFLSPQVITGSLAAEIGKIRAASTVGLRDLEEPGKLVTLQDGYLYFEKRDAGNLYSGAYVDTTATGTRISGFARAGLVQRGGETILTLPDPPRSVVLRPRAGETGSFTPDSQAASIFGLAGEFNRRYLDAAHRPAEMLLVCVLFTAVVLSSSFFLRATRWPLANIFMTLLVLAGILALYNFISLKVVDELVKIFGPRPAFILIPTGVLAFFATLFFLLDFVFLREKRKEAAGA